MEIGMGTAEQERSNTRLPEGSGSRASFLNFFTLEL
jgi:hypothetical protein